MTRRVLAVGIDATPAHLVIPWAREGKLPVLGRLMREGAHAEVRSLSYDVPENFWPSIATGCGPGSHGVYDWRAPRPGSYARVAQPPRTRRLPFWRLLRDPSVHDGEAPRSLVLDVPYAGFERQPGCVQVVGWGERGARMHVSHPEGLLSEIVATHGAYPTNLNREALGRPLVSRSQLRTILLMTEKRTAVLADLMRRYPWEVCVAAYFEPHYAGHAFHGYAAPERYAAVGAPPRFRRGLEDALLRCYRAADAALGELIAAAPPGTHVAAFSGIGLRPNTNGVDILERVLEGLGYKVPVPAVRSARGREVARRAALRVVPRPLLRAVRARVAPGSVQAHLEKLWLDGTDWAASRAFAEGEPGWGYVRLNVRGRDPEGTVEPGDEYTALCDEIAAELRLLVIPETGEPAVDQVVHRDELMGPDAEAPLPDLYVRWSRRQIIRSVRHPRLGVIHDDLKDFRATEHDDDGWLVLAGPDVRAGVDGGEVRIEDIAPTLMHLMGAAVPSRVEGRVLTELLAPSLGEVERSDAPVEDVAWVPA